MVCFIFSHLLFELRITSPEWVYKEIDNISVFLLFFVKEYLSILFLYIFDVYFSNRDKLIIELLLFMIKLNSQFSVLQYIIYTSKTSGLYLLKSLAFFE